MLRLLVSNTGHGFVLGVDIVTGGEANIQNNAREVFSINKGKVIIGIKNNINTFHFEVDDVNGKEIKGSFKGILMRI